MAEDRHEDVANLLVSKESVKVGYLEGDETVYLQIEDQSDPTYMSPEEAEMIISALRVAVHKCRGDK